MSFFPRRVRPGGAPGEGDHEAYDRHGKPFTLEAEGFMARAICHENDHLDGHIFKDITHHMLTDEELRELDEE